MRSAPLRRAEHSATPTVGTALAGAAALLKGETPSPQRDAELLLAHVSKQPREYVLAHREAELSLRQQRAFTSLVRRLTEGIPLSYLTGTKEFYGRTFIVTPAVMVPRAETEAVVTESLRFLDQAAELHPIVADIGTGSGVLAVTIAVEAPRARVAATDKSPAALTVARRNARKHRVSGRMTFIESDLLTEIPPELSPHLIAANLPYVLSDELKHAGEKLETRGLTWEPKAALDGGPDGLFVIRRFFAQLKRTPEIKKTLQSLVLEHSPTQQRTITELAYDTLPKFQSRAVTPFVTSWTKTASGSG